MFDSGFKFDVRLPYNMNHLGSPLAVPEKLSPWREVLHEKYLTQHLIVTEPGCAINDAHRHCPVLFIQFRKHIVRPK